MGVSAKTGMYKKYVFYTVWGNVVDVCAQCMYAYFGIRQTPVVCETSAILSTSMAYIDHDDTKQKKHYYCQKKKKHLMK